MKQKHARVKELFLQARELTPENREEFLRRECGGDTTLGEEVTSLLDFDNSKTILARPDRLLVELSSQVGRPRGGLLGRLERAVSELLQQVLIRPGRRIVVVIVAISLLAGIAVWTHSGMKRATQTIAASELQTILNADIMALELWIEEKKKDVLLVMRNTLWSKKEMINSALNTDILVV